MTQRKTAVLAGVTHGPGVKVVLTLANLGYDICLLSHQREDAERLQARVQVMHQQCEIYDCRVENAESLSEVFDQILSKHDQIDLMLTNMGQMPDSEHYANKFVGDLTTDDWTKYLESTLKGAVNCINASVSVMSDNQQPSYIFATAMFGVSPVSRRSLYTLSRYAIMGLIDTVNVEASERKSSLIGKLLIPKTPDNLDEEFRRMIRARY